MWTFKAKLKLLPFQPFTTVPKPQFYKKACSNSTLKILHWLSWSSLWMQLHKNSTIKLHFCAILGHHQFDKGITSNMYITYRCAFYLSSGLMKCGVWVNTKKRKPPGLERWHSRIRRHLDSFRLKTKCTYCKNGLIAEVEKVYTKINICACAPDLAEGGGVEQDALIPLLTWSWVA